MLIRLVTVPFLIYTVPLVYIYTLLYVPWKGTLSLWHTPSLIINTWTLNS